MTVIHFQAPSDCSPTPPRGRARVSPTRRASWSWRASLLFSFIRRAGSCTARRRTHWRTYFRAVPLAVLVVTVGRFHLTGTTGPGAFHSVLLLGCNGRYLNAVDHAEGGPVKAFERATPEMGGESRDGEGRDLSGKIKDKLRSTN